MQTPCTASDLTRHAIIGLTLSGCVCLALAAIGAAHENAETYDAFQPLRVDHIAAQLRYAPSRQVERAGALIGPSQ